MNRWVSREGVDANLLRAIFYLVLAGFAALCYSEDGRTFWLAQVIVLPILAALRVYRMWRSPPSPGERR